MLSNKAPNLEAKKEKGISNNQTQSGGWTSAMPHVFKEKQPPEINCSFQSQLTPTSPHHCAWGLLKEMAGG